MKKKSILLLAIALLFSFNTAIATTLDNKGTDFWLAFPSNLTPDYLSFYITGDSATSGTVTIPSLSFTENFTVTPGSVTTVTVSNDIQISSIDTVEDKGIHITSDDEIIVYGINKNSSTSDAYMGLPTDVLGTEYRVMSYRASIASFGSYFVITGTEDGTTVTITPSVDVDNNARDAANSYTAGTPYDISLDKGDTYRLETVLQNDDMTGTLITSDKPISVFSGVECVNIGAGACDHIVEQLPPTDTFGKKFATMPLELLLNNIRILAHEDNTEVIINGSTVATLAAGDFHDVDSADALYIETSKPTIVAQFSQGGGAGGMGDPFMMLIPPYEQFMNSYTVTTPASGFDTYNYVNVIVVSAGKGSISLDNALIAETEFTQISTSDLYGAKVPVDVGSHTLASDYNFGAFSYGFASANSYGYAGGSSFAPVASFDHVTFTAPTESTYAVNTQVCSSATAYKSDNSVLAGVGVMFTVSGANTASETVTTDTDGVAEFCYTPTNEGTDTITWTDINNGTGNTTVTISDTPAPAPSVTISVPVLLTPDAAFLSSSAVTFTWETVTNATKYYITITGNVSLSDVEITSADITVANGVISWICPVALPDGDYTWTVSSASDIDTSDYATVKAFNIERPTAVSDLGDGDDIDYENMTSIDSVALNSIEGLAVDYPIHTETGLSVEKEINGETVVVKTIAQVNLGSLIENTEVSDIVVNTGSSTMTIEDADSFPDAITDEGETVDNSALGLIIQAYEADATTANFDVTMLVTQGSNAGAIVHKLGAPISFVISDLDMVYEAGENNIQLNGVALTEVALNGSDSTNADGYWFYDASTNSYHVTVYHFSEVSVNSKLASSEHDGSNCPVSAGGCSAVSGTSGADMGLIFLAMIMVFFAYRGVKTKKVISKL